MYPMRAGMLRPDTAKAEDDALEDEARQGHTSGNDGRGAT